MTFNRINAVARNIQRQIIRRRIPHAVLSWRYFLPRQTEYVRIHRQIFLNAWPTYPRIVWLAIASWSYLTWYLFHSWVFQWRAWRKYSGAISKDCNISRLRQWLDLIILSWGHSTPAIYYYLYQLYNVPESTWLNYIFTHELPHWHLLESPELGSHTSKLMTHKYHFTNYLETQGLPAITNIALLVKGSIVDDSLFKQQSLFLKPECGSQRKGCYELHYDPAGNKYELSGVDKVNGKQQIKAYLQAKIEEQDYLVQPMLENHPLLLNWFNCTALITLRVITLIHNAKVYVLCINIEIPRDTNLNTVYPLPVSIHDGTIGTSNILELIEHCVHSTDQQTSNEKGSDKQGIDKQGFQKKSFNKHCYGQQLPLWETVVNTATRAHQLFPDLKTIGWDLAITGNGVKILEGNINWAVAAHQQNNSPLLPQYLQLCIPKLNNVSL